MILHTANTTPGKSSGASFVSTVCIRVINIVLTSLDSTEGPGTFPERRNQPLNSRVEKVVVERRLSCPWYFWGLEGFTRERFPEGWPYFYEDGEEGDVSQDNQLLYPWEELQTTSAASPVAAKGANKTGIWNLPSSEMEKSVEDMKLQIAEARAMLDEKKRKADDLRAQASTTVDGIQKKAVAVRNQILAGAEEESRKMQREADAKCDKIRKEADTEFNEIQTDVSKLEQTMKEKEAVLEVREITLAARRANDSYAN